MPIDPRIKSTAHKLDPECWVSYAGKPANYKRYMEGRRTRSLDLAASYIRIRDRFHPMLQIRGDSQMSPMKIAMMLHFYSVVGPFGPDEVRRSDAYVQFVRELLHAGMIERPTREQRHQHPGWAYRATDKGRVYVEALTQVPLPIAEQAVTRWVMPGQIGEGRRVRDATPIFTRLDKR